METKSQDQSISEKKPPDKGDPVSHDDFGKGTVLFNWGKSGHIIFKEHLTLFMTKQFTAKTLFLLPSNKVGKDYIEELKSFINFWANDSVLKDISFKGTMVAPSSILQRPVKSSTDWFLRGK